MVDIRTVVAVVGSLGTVAGIALTSYYHHRTQSLLEERKRVTWWDLRDEAQELRSEIEEEFDPDIIVTPGIRGATVTNMMRGGNERTLAPDVRVYVGIREELDDNSESFDFDHYLPVPPTTKFRHYVPAEILNERGNDVLILEAFNDTGQSLNSFESYLRENGFPADAVRTAAVVTSEESVADGNDPDFFSKEISRPFYLPWGKAV